MIAGFVLGGSLLLAFSISIDGVEIWRGYVDMMLRNPDLTQQLWSSLERHFSFRSLVSVPFRETSLAVPVGALGSVAAVMLAIWFRQKLTPTLASAPHSFPALSLLLGACAFATPHLLDYDLVLYFPLMIWASYRIAEKRAHNMGLGIAALSAFMSSRSLIRSAPASTSASGASLHCCCSYGARRKYRSPIQRGMRSPDRPRATRGLRSACDSATCAAAISAAFP